MKLKRRDDGFETELRDGLTIGRVASCDLTISDNSVSRNHAQVRAEDGGFVLTDLNSSNGTTLNGMREKECALRVGDTLIFGRVVFCVTDNIESQSVMPPIQPAATPEPSSPSAAAYEPTAADQERARLRRQAVSGRRSSGLGDLSQQSPLVRFVVLVLAVAFLALVVIGVRWMAHTINAR